jgi:Zn-dependent protease
MGWWVADLYNGGQRVLLVSWIFWVIFSITLHELAHGWAALWQGDDTPRRLNRMTLNPLVHMGPFSLLVFAIIGIAWGVMPTDPSRYRWRRRGRIVVAGAGPAMNILLAFLALTLAGVWLRYGPQADPLQQNVWVFLVAGGWLNLILAGLNLLPVPPLDGSSILAGLSWRYYRLMHHPQAGMVGMLLIVAIFFSGIGDVLFVAAMDLGAAYAGLVASILP